MSNAKITLGREAIRVVAGEVRRTIPRHQIVGLDRVSGRAVLMFRSADTQDPSVESILTAEFNDTAEAQGVEDWILDGMPGVVVPAETIQQAVEPTIKPGQEIGPGSVVEYLGKIHEVSREAHDHENGIHKWRLNGHTSRGVNESALRLVTPIRAGDLVEMRGTHGPVRGRASQYDKEIAAWNIGLEDGTRYTYVADDQILHATRDTDDGVVVVR